MASRIRKNEVIACEICGLYVPSADVLTKNNNFYCSIEHLKQGKL